MAKRLKLLLSEPLVHFLAIGAVLYGASYALAPPKADPNLIRMDAAAYGHLSDLFKKDRGRPPTPAEMDKMVDLQIKSETLYREAMNLGLHTGDDMIRERLAQRMRFMMYSSITVPVPDDATLREWLAGKPGKYNTPATVSLEIIGLDTTRQKADAMAERANAREEEGNPIKPTEAYLVRFKDRPRTHLVRLFGEDFVAAIEALPKGRWTAVNSPKGWQIAKLVATTPEKVAKFEDIVATARADWREEQRQAQARAALADLMARYPVDRAPYGETVAPAEDRE